MNLFTSRFLLLGLILASLTSNAQTITLFQDNFDTNPCVGHQCTINGYNGWTVGLDNVGPLSNAWFVSTNENGGGAQGSCGQRGVSTHGTLHIGTTFAQDSFFMANGIPQYMPCTTGDCGDTYFSGMKPAVENQYGVTGAFATDIEAQSPVINCTNYGCPVYLTFNYMNNAASGDILFIEQWYSDNHWTPIANIPISDTCATGDGIWSKMTVELDYPNTANNPDVRIGFRWTNEDDSSGYHNSSAAIDSLVIFTTPTPQIEITSLGSLCVPADTVISPTNADPDFNYVWTINGALRLSNSPTLDTLNQSFDSVGTFPVYLTVSSPTCSQTDTSNIVVKDCNTITVAFTPGDTSICANQCLNFTNNTTATDSVTYEWTFGGGSITTSALKTPPQICWNNPGPFQVKLLVTDIYGMKDSAISTITVKPLPVLTMSNDTAICAGASATLTVSGATTYAWSPASGLNNVTASTVSATPASTTTYSVTGTTNGCSNNDSVIVTLNPVLTISADTTICMGMSATLTVIGATTYTWAPATGLSKTDTSTVTASPASTTTYTVTGTANGCTNHTSVAVTVKPLPVLTVSNDTGICLGATANLNVNGAITYSWSPATGLSNTSGAGITATPNATTVYTVTGTGANGCPNKDSITITINPVLTISNDTSICTSSNVTLTVSGATTYTWAPGTGLNKTDTSTVISKPNVSVTYTVTGTANGCTNTANVTVMVNKPPVLNLSADTTMCQGASAHLRATGATTYLWSPTTALTDSTSASTFASPTTSTTYSVTGATNGCTDTRSIIVTVNPAPILTISADTSICTGGSANLTVSGATTYSWMPTTGLNSNNTPNVTASPASSTTYTVTGTANGCKSNDSVTVTVSPVPTLTLSNDTNICSGNSATLTVSGATTYSWAPATGLSSTSAASTTASPASTTIYTVTGSNSGCSTMQLVSVTVNPSPAVTASDDTSVCSGNAASLSVSGANTYSWAPSASLNNSTAVSVIATPSATTTYTVTGTSVNGCTGSKTVSVTVNPTPALTPGSATTCSGANATLSVSGASTYTWAPATDLNTTTGASVTSSSTVNTTYTVTGASSAGCTAQTNVTLTVMTCTDTVKAIIAFDSSICQNECIQITDNSTGRITSWLWTFEGGNPGTSSEQDPGSVCYSTAGTYSISLNITGLYGAADSTTQQIVVNPSPTLTVNPDTVRVNVGTPVQLDADAHGVKLYKWSPDANISNDTIPNPVVTPYDTIVYTVTATASNGCTSQKNVVVDAAIQNLIFLPNLFTPNGDGVNDYFQAYLSRPVSQFQLTIFDQWGGEVFSTNNVNGAWDGTSKGKECLPGVYVWIYQLKFITDNHLQIGTGNVTLIR